MTTHVFTDLLMPQEPWFYRWIGSDTELATFLAIANRPEFAGARIILLRGERLSTVQDVFVEFATALEFPEYFGKNWDALFDCLCDLAWLPAKAYILLIINSENLAAATGILNENILLTVLWDACVRWNRPIHAGVDPIPFHVVFSFDPKQTSRVHEAIVSIPDELTF